VNRTRVVLAVGTAQTLAWASSYYLPAVLADPIAETLGLSRSWVFGAFSIALVLMAVVGPAIGRHIDGRGGRRVLVASALVLPAGLVLLAGAQGPISLVLAWVVLGLGMALGLYETAFAALAHLYGREARGPITGITLMAGFASTIGWPATAALAHAAGWRAACLAWAIVHLAVTLPCYLAGLPRRAAPVAEPDDDEEVAPDLDAPAHAPPRNAMLLLGITFAIVAFVSTAMAAHLPRLLQASGAGVAAAIAAAALVGPAQVAARFMEYLSMHRWQPHPVIAARVAAGLHPLAAGLLALVGGAGFMAPLFALLHGAGNGLLTIARGTLPLALFGPVGYGFRQGTIGAGARLAQAAAPLAFGILLDDGSVGLALAVSGGLSFIALLALLALRGKR
jgi:predicted MFS family arabinose efflux permease